MHQRGLTYRQEPEASSQVATPPLLTLQKFVGLVAALNHQLNLSGYEYQMI